MELQLLREFMFLSKDLSFTRTAERCYLSQSVFSRHIQALEAELGCQLVIRDKSGIRLTPFGESFAKSCQRIDADFSKALAELDSIRGGFTETLRIAYESPLPPRLIDRTYALELERHPQVKLDLMASWEERAVVLLNQDKVDLSFQVVFEKPDPAVFDTLPICRQDYVIVMPEGHRLCDAEAVRLRDLKGETLFVPAARDFPTQYERITEALERLSEITVVASLNNKHDAVALPRAGKGLSLVRGCVVSPLAEGVRMVPLGERGLEPMLCAVWKQANRRQALSDFVGILRELCPDGAYRE